MMSRYKWVKVKKKFISFHEKDLKCFYCNKSLLRENVTIDHKIPLSKGGDPYDFSNLAISCHFCNQVKDDMTSDVFFEKINSGFLDEKINEFREKKEFLSSRFDDFFSNELYSEKDFFVETDLSCSSTKVRIVLRKDIIKIIFGNKISFFFKKRIVNLLLKSGLKKPKDKTQTGQIYFKNNKLVISYSFSNKFKKIKTYGFLTKKNTFDYENSNKSVSVVLQNKDLTQFKNVPIDFKNYILSSFSLK